MNAMEGITMKLLRLIMKGLIVAFSVGNICRF
jgi:hypothetical protein